MTTYKYKDGDKEIIANQMEDVENVSYRETMVKFHASSIAPAIKLMLEKDKNFNLPCNDEIINQVALMFAKQSYSELSKESVDSKLKNIFQKELNKKEQIRLLKGVQLTEPQLSSLFNFAENGIHWHCFLQTYKGLKGMESGVQGSRPHLHYLSDSFGISKDDLVKMIKMGKYPNTPVHIPLLSDKSED